MKLRMPILVMILGFLPGAAAFAQVISFAWDNDIVFKQDGGYTNGARLSWLGDPKSQQSCPDCRSVRFGEALSWVPGFSRNHDYFLGSSIEQLMITPQDISVTIPQYEDIPYAGLLRGNLVLIGRSQQTLTAYGISFGVTGKGSGASGAQRAVHRQTGSTAPMGWNTQLPQEWVVGILAGHSREWMRGSFGGLEGVLVSAGGVQADHWQGVAELSFYGGIGRRMPHNFLPMFGATGNAGSMVGINDIRGLGWMIYLGLESQAIGWSYMEREGKKAGYSFRNEDAIGALSGGIALQYQSVMAVLSMRSTTEYVELGEGVKFGSFSLVYRF